MFEDASSFNHDISGWTGTAATSVQTDMFTGATAFNAKYTCADANNGPASTCKQGVLVISITHYTVGSNGQYFYYDEDKLVDVFGSFTFGGKQVIHQYRHGILISSGTVVVWDNTNGMHGRYNTGAQPGQWEVGDLIRPEYNR